LSWKSGKSSPYLVDSKFNKAMKAIPFLAAGMIFNMLLRKKK
jgi:hypothetical protein